MNAEQIFSHQYTVCKVEMNFFFSKLNQFPFVFYSHGEDEKKKKETIPVTVERFIKLAFVFIRKVLQSTEPDVHVNTSKCIEKVAPSFA